MVEQGAIRLVSSEKFRTTFMKAASKEIAKRIRLSMNGMLGVDKKLEKNFMGALVEGDEGLASIKGLLPKKAQDMIDKHPQLIELGMKFLPNILEKLGAGEDGQT